MPTFYNCYSWKDSTFYGQNFAIQKLSRNNLFRRCIYIWQFLNNGHSNIKPNQTVDSCLNLNKNSRRSVRYSDPTYKDFSNWNFERMLLYTSNQIFCTNNEDLSSFFTGIKSVWCSTRTKWQIWVKFWEMAMVFA